MLKENEFSQVIEEMAHPEGLEPQPSDPK